MKAVVIGATGHTGTYLVPRLVDYGFEVIAVTRGLSEPYTPAGEWREVKRIQPVSYTHLQIGEAVCRAA